MDGQQLFTWGALGTMSGASLFTFFVVLYTKELIARILPGLSTGLYSVIIGLIILTSSALAQGANGADWRIYVLALANGFLVAATAGHMNDKAINPPGSSKGGGNAGQDPYSPDPTSSLSPKTKMDVPAGRKYSLKKDSHDARDFVFKSRKTKLPDQVDLRTQDTPIFDQGQLGSCTANAINGLKQFLDNQKAGSYTILSRLFLYWQERKMEGTVNEDSGAMIRDGMKALQTIGCCPEADYPYDIQKFTQTPSAKAAADAGAHKIVEYHRIKDFTAMQSALAEGLPVVIGIKVYDSFESDKVAQTGMVPLPRTGEQFLGGHAVLVVGYKKIGRTIYAIVRNSWGEGWGDKGYFYLPKSFFNKYVTDMWTGK